MLLKARGLPVFHLADFSFGVQARLESTRLDSTRLGASPRSQTASKSWSEICLRHYWNVARYFATLPVHRWIKRVMAWHPQGHRRIGRPKYRWDSMIENLPFFLSFFLSFFRPSESETTVLQRTRGDNTIIHGYKPKWARQNCT